MKMSNDVAFAVICLTACAGAVGLLILPFTLAWGVKEGTWTAPLLAFVSVFLLAGALYTGSRHCRRIGAKLARQPGSQAVSMGRYAAIKALAMGLSGGALLSIISLAFVLLLFALAWREDTRSQERCHAQGCSKYELEEASDYIFFPQLLLVLYSPIPFLGYAAWRGSRKSWHTVRAMEQIIHSDIPLPDSLLRASQESVQAQEAVLLRAVTQTQSGQEDQLLRAASAVK